MPLAEVVTDFFDALKSRTKGYASMEYAITGESARFLMVVSGAFAWEWAGKQRASKAPPTAPCGCPGELMRRLACPGRTLLPSAGYRENDLVLLEIKINGEPVDPLACIVHRDSAYAVRVQHADRTWHSMHSA